MSQDRRTNNSRAPLIAAVVLAVALLGGVNYAMQRTTPAPASDHDHEGEGGEGQTQASPQATPAAAGGQQLLDLGDNKMLGQPGARTEVVIGWQMTPQVQADPSKVYNAVQMAQEAVQRLGDKVKVRIVNVDANPSVPLGVSVGGKMAVPAQADGSLDPAKVQNTFASFMGNKQ